jgi:MoxR-like ATPase
MLYANGDVYETILFNNIECIQYTITIAGESIPLYAPASFIGTKQESNPTMNLNKKNTTCDINFMGSCLSNLY